jgi:DNA-directed RNA polymerase specialized sigma24 family protein
MEGRRPRVVDNRAPSWLDKVADQPGIPVPRSLAEAEDAVQEADAHWYGLSRSQQAAVVSPDAWLNTVTTRVCLDVLRPARARRERYVGEWLP